MGWVGAVIGGTSHSSLSSSFLPVIGGAAAVWLPPAAMTVPVPTPSFSAEVKAAIDKVLHEEQRDKTMKVGLIGEQHAKALTSSISGESMLCKSCIGRNL